MDLSCILDDLRDAALDPAAWPRVHAGTEEWLGAFASQRASVDHRSGNRFHCMTTRVPEIDTELLVRAPTSEPVLWASRNPRWRRFVDHDFIDDRGMDRSGFYAFCEGFEIRYMLGLRVVDEPGISKAIVWFWRRRDGPAGPRQLARLAAIEAPLRLSASVAVRLGAGFAVERGLLDALETSDAAALLADDEGSVLLANAPMRALLRLRDGMFLAAGGRFALHGRQSARHLANALRRAAARPSTSGSGGGRMAVPRPSGKTPFLLTLVPLARRHQLFGPERPLVLVLATAADATRSPTKEILRMAFGLTEAEAATAALLAEARTPAEIAERRGVALETVRSQVKAVMAKTATSRQVELVRLLAMLA